MASKEVLSFTIKDRPGRRGKPSPIRLPRQDGQSTAHHGPAFRTGRWLMAQSYVHRRPPSRIGSCIINRLIIIAMMRSRVTRWARGFGGLPDGNYYGKVNNSSWRVPSSRLLSAGRSLALVVFEPRLHELVEFLHLFVGVGFWRAVFQPTEHVSFD